MKVKSFTENENLELIKQNGNLIRFVKNPTDEMKIASLKQNPNNIKFIENPTEEMIFLSKQVKVPKLKSDLEVREVQHKVESSFNPYF